MIKLRNHFTLVLILTSSSALFVGCAPKLIIVDRQTILEQEAAGEWPQFERDLVQGATAQLPTPLPSTPETKHKERLFNVLNGQLVAAPNVPAATPTPRSGGGK